MDGKMVAVAMEGHNIAVIDTSKLEIPPDEVKPGQKAITQG